MWLKIILLIIKTRGGDAGWSKECLRRGKTEKTQKSWKTLKNDEFGGFWWYFMDLEGFQAISWDFGDISKVFEGISLRKLASGPEIDRKSCVASLRTRGVLAGSLRASQNMISSSRTPRFSIFPGLAGRPYLLIRGTTVVAPKGPIVKWPRQSVLRPTKWCSCVRPSVCLMSCDDDVCHAPIGPDRPIGPIQIRSVNHQQSSVNVIKRKW